VTFDAVTQESLKAVGQPQIDDLKYEDKGPLSFKAKVEIKPRVPPLRRGGPETDAPSETVTDKDVDDQVEALRQRPVGGRRRAGPPAINGDTVKIDFQGFIEGQPFPGGTAQDTTWCWARTA